MSEYSIENKGGGVGVLFYDGVEIGEIILRQDSVGVESVSVEPEIEDRTFIESRSLQFVVADRSTKTSYVSQTVPEWFGPRVNINSIGGTSKLEDRHVDLADLETYTFDEIKARLSVEGEGSDA